MKSLRTVVNGTVFNERSGKFGVRFETFASDSNGEYLSGVVESPMIFDTADLAIEAGGRALDTLDKTGAFPNMCKEF